MVIIIAFVFIILIVVFSLIAIMKEEVVTMSKLRNIYLYLVSFVALMMIIAGTIFTVQSITDVLFPTNNYFQPEMMDKTGNITSEDKKTSQENQIRQVENQKIESKKNVAKSVAVVVVALPVFMYHWRKIEKEKKEQV